MSRVSMHHFKAPLVLLSTVLSVLSASRAVATISVLSDLTVSTFVGDVWVGKADWCSSCFTTSPTLTIASGGYTTSVNSFNASAVNIFGGGGSGPIVAWDTSSILLGDLAFADNIQARDSSVVTVAGGRVGTLIVGADTARIIVNDMFSGQVSAHGHSSATINGGTLGAVDAADNGTVTMNGGLVQAIFSSGSGVFGMYGGEVLSNAINNGSDSTLAVLEGKIDGSLIGLGGITVMAGGGVLGSASAQASSAVYLSDGEIVGDATASGTSHLGLTGSTVDGNVIASGDSDVHMTGGEVVGSVTASGNSTLSISGGTILGGLYALGNSIVDVSGGQIDDPSMPGWYLNDGSLLDIHGFGLGDSLLDPDFGNQYSEFLLSGSLLDGTSIDGKLLFMTNGTGAGFELLNAAGAPGGSVPEPGSIGLIAVGCVVAGIARRRFTWGTASNLAPCARLTA